MKKLLSVILSAAITLGSIAVVSVGAEEKPETKREVIAEYKYDNSGKTPGSNIDEYLVENSENRYIYSQIPKQYYTPTYGKGGILYYGMEEFKLKWSEKSYISPEGEDIGIVPKTESIKIGCPNTGYKFVHLSFDACADCEEGETDTLQLFFDIERGMEDRTEVPLKGGNKMQRFNINYKLSEYELDMFNNREIEINIGSTDSILITNIVFTGVQYDVTEGRRIFFGDATEDDRVTIADATAVQKHALGIDKIQYVWGGSTVKDVNLDVNCDGRVSILDVTCIQKYLAGYTDGIGTVGQFSVDEGENHELLDRAVNAWWDIEHGK